MPLRETIRAVRRARMAWMPAGPWAMRARLYGRPGARRIVLVHGLGMSSLYLAPTALRLAAAYEVWTPELPGFGASPAPPAPLPIPALADALAAFLRRFDGPVPLLGNSLGCQVLVDLAARYAACASRLVLVGPTVDPAARTVARQALRLLADAPREAPSLLAVGLYDYLRAGPGRFWGTLRHALADPVEQKLARVPQPALVVCGARDPIAPRRWAESVAQQLPRGRLVVLPGVPHGANYSAADTLVRAIRPFLAQEIRPGEPSARIAE